MIKIFKEKEFWKSHLGKKSTEGRLIALSKAFPKVSMIVQLLERHPGAIELL